jgi:hypothetical protein
MGIDLKGLSLGLLLRTRIQSAPKLLALIFLKPTGHTASTHAGFPFPFLCVLLTSRDHRKKDLL